MALAGRAAWLGVVHLLGSNSLTFASSIAYYTLLSTFPFLLLVLSIASRLTLAYSPETVATIFAETLPRQFDFLVDRVNELASAPLKLSLASTVLSIWASMGVFGALTSAVNHAWGVQRSYSFLKHRLVAFVMLLAAGLLLFGALALNGMVAVVQADWFAKVVDDFPWLQGFSSFASRNASTPLFILVVGLIYYFAPNTRVRLRDVWFGAILAGLLWRLALTGFSWYVTNVSSFSVHGSIAAVVVFLVWVYMSAVILLYGVEVTAAYAKLRKDAGD